MRIKGLDGGRAGPAVIIFATFLLVVALFLIGMRIKDANAAEGQCLITKAQILEQNKALHMGDPQAMPAKFLSGFIEHFNEEPPKINGAADNVIVMQHPEIPLVRVIFLRGNCFVNYYDAPIPTFMKLLQQSVGQGI